MRNGNCKNNFVKIQKPHMMQDPEHTYFPLLALTSELTLDFFLWKSGEADRGLSLQAAEVAHLAEVRGHQITDQPQHLLHQ